MRNYLPPIEIDRQRQSKIDNYDKLGMKLLLDLTRWHYLGHRGNSISDYLEESMSQLENSVVIFSFNDESKPTGYAVCQQFANDDGCVTLDAQVAPFGDYVDLQDIVKNTIFGVNSGISLHPLSARPEQRAW